MAVDKSSRRGRVACRYNGDIIGERRLRIRMAASFVDGWILVVV